MMQEWQKLNDVLDNMLRETVARGDTVAPGWRDEVRAVVRDMLAAERERSAKAADDYLTSRIGCTYGAGDAVHGKWA
jgi:hypothetical protein